MNSIELQQLLSDMKSNFQNFKCTLQDLKNPNEEFVTNFYCYWLQEFEVDIKGIYQTQFSQTAIVSVYQDAYSGMIPKANLLNSIRAFDVIPDFGILDIISPAPKRIQTILRAFINFYIWADNRASGVINNKQVLNERKIKLTKETKDREDLKENLNTVIRSIVQMKDSKSQLEMEFNQLQQKSSELLMEKNLLRTTIDNLNEILKDKENFLQKVNKEDCSVSSKIKDYSTLLVDSPSSVIAELKGLRAKNEIVIEASEQKRKLVESKILAHKNLHKVLEDQNQRDLELSDILAYINQQRELLQTVSIIEKNTNSNQDMLCELKSLLISQNTKKQNCQETLQSLYLKWKTLKPQLLESVNTALGDLNSKKKEKNKMINHLKENALVEDDINCTLKLINGYITDYLVDYENIKKQEMKFVRQYESYTA